ncbi:MAG: hypothetical protein IPM39_28120 [Chloroflexi bacterium]|nr:hypothetical protein [Chloroflexota bacterium]
MVLTNSSLAQQPPGSNGQPPTALTLSRQTQLEQMRPALIIGTGGTGQIILTYLKVILETRYGPLWRQRIRLLAFDTAEEPFSVPGPHGLVMLEPTSEFIHIGNVPVLAIKRNLRSQEAIQERLGSIMNTLAPVVLRSGAKQLRVLGLLAMLWNYTAVSEQISQALWSLAGRGQTDAAHVSQQQGINVFICGSLVGGTGSGTMLDLAYLVRDYFTELGAQAEFCHITGIGVLHQAFQGITGPNIVANCGAFLRELNHLMVKDGFRARYPDGRTIQAQEAPFDIFHAIDGVDARGQTWNDIYEVAAMTAEAMFLQMGTQMGRKGENAFDNLDEALSGQTADGQGHFLGSFGKGDLLFDAPMVAELHTDWFLLELLRENWLLAAQRERADQLATGLLAGLSGDQVRSYLRLDPETGQEWLVDLTPPAWLTRKGADELPAEASQYVQEYGQARIKEVCLPQISQQAEQLIQATRRQWEEWLVGRLFAVENSPATLVAALTQTQEALHNLTQQAQKQIAAEEQTLSRLAETVSQLETALNRAATGFPLGRANRIRVALTHYFQAAQSYHETQVSHHLTRAQRSVWFESSQWVGRHIQALTSLRERLAGIRDYLEAETPRRLQKLSAGGIATVSLASPEFVTALYQRHRPGWADVPHRLGNGLTWLSLDQEGLLQELTARLSPYFEPVKRIGVEQAIREQAEEVSPRARRQQLFQLATPSWNLNRARLVDGGAGLARLEVLGVPDVGDTLFDGEPMMVSTHDPYRLTALVVVAGAPPSALQQYDLYQQALERHQNKRPLYVLPDFLISSDQGRLMFALGSIFGLIYSQGTFFYYQPADPLSIAVKLANGLANAINAFIEREELVAEVNERVNAQIAGLGLREAIHVLSGYYSSVSPGPTSLDEPLRELKRLVRDYTDSLRSIDAFSAGIHAPARRM